MASQSCRSTSAAGPAKQDQLQRARIIDVRRKIEQAFAGPPDAHRCGERILLLKHEGPRAYERHDQLQQTAPSVIMNVPNGANTMWPVSWMTN